MVKLAEPKHKVEEITPEQYAAIEKFAEGLKECFENSKRNGDNPFAKTTLIYVISIINLHLQLEELRLDLYGNNLQRSIDGE